MTLQFRTHKDDFRAQLLSYVQAHWNLSVATVEWIVKTNILEICHPDTIRVEDDDRKLLPHKQNIAALLMELFDLDAQTSTPAGFITDFFALAYFMLFPKADETSKAEWFQSGATAGSEWEDAIISERERRRKDKKLKSTLSFLHMIQSPLKLGRVGRDLSGWFLQKRDKTISDGFEQVFVGLANDGGWYRFFVPLIVIAGNPEDDFKEMHASAALSWRALDDRFQSLR